MRFNGKKALAMLLALIMVLGMMPATASAAGASGSCGDNATYKLSSDGTLTISGTGATDDYYFEGKNMAQWDKPSPFAMYGPQIKRVVVEPGITRIGRGNFWCHDNDRYDNLTSVSFPNTLLEIGEYAFCNAPLTSVKLPTSLKTVGESAFYNTGVISVEVPAANYSDEVFADCSKLTSIKFIEAGADSDLGWPTFQRCHALTSVTIPGYVKRIRWGMFDFCENLKTVIMEEGVERIETRAFNSCHHLSNVYMPQNSLKSIGTYAFSQCNMATFVIPRSNPEIKQDAFYNSDLVNLVIPKEITEVAGNAYSSCNYIEYVFIEGSERNFAYRDYEFPYGSRKLTQVLTGDRGQVFNNFDINGFGFTSGCTSKEPDRSGGGTGGDNTGTDKPGGNTGTDKPGGSTGSDKTAVCTVKFDANGGSGSMSTERVESGSSYTLPDCAFTAPSGKEFKAWNINGKEYAPGKSLKVTGKDGSILTVQAVWKDASATTPVSQRVKVEYDANGGSGSMSSERVENGSSYTLPDCAFTAPSGKEFKAWNINGKEYAPGKSLKVTGEDGSTLTVQAVWKDTAKPTGVIAYDSNGGSGFMPSKTLAVGTEFALPKCSYTPPIGQVFQAWSIDGKEYAPNATITVKAGTITVKALWKDGSGSTSATSGNFGDGLTWELSANGTLTIQGRGSMPDYNSTSKLAPWSNLADKISSVVLKEGVYNIGSWAFVDCTWLSSVEIPDTVVFIGDCAFYNCGRLGLLNTVKLPDSVTYMAGSPFNRCHENLVLEYAGSKAEFAKIVSSVDRYDDIEIRYGKQNAPEQGGVSANTSFSDVNASAYYYDSVRWAVENRVTTGTGATTFSPDKTCTTAEILTFLWRASGSPAPKSRSSFSDIKPGDFYYKAALWAKQNELVTGDAFNGNTPCTRSATVTYLWTLVNRPAGGSVSQFTDVGENDACAAAVAWAVSKGITKGTSETTFSPELTCTRGQIVTFLYRFKHL